MKRFRILFMLLFITASAMAADLTANWVAKEDRKDGTYRTTYFNLKQEGDKITGHIRMTQFYYTIASSTGTPDNFTITATMQDGPTLRKVTYEGKLEGDKLHMATRRRPTDPLTELVAERAPEGEGALPARVPPPALHKVPYNGLAKTPPMGWNSWNKFAGRVDDATVRTIADAMVSSGMKDAGYQYINIDDTWEGARDAQG